MREEKSFEASLVRLEEIVKKMEQGNVSLDESLRLFEEGTALVKYCSGQLDTAEQKVTILMNGPENAPIEMPFSSETV